MTDADTDGSGDDTPVEDTDEKLRFDAPDDADVSILTHGEPIREFVRLQTPLVDEARWQFTDDGIVVQAVDPANVGMIDLDAYDGGFDQYRKRTDDLEVGMPLTTGGNLKNALAFARKGRGSDNGDPVRIDILDRGKRVRIAILRPDQNTKRVSEFYAIDPDSMRQKPDIPDLNLTYRAAPGIEPLTDGIRDLDRSHDHVWFTAIDRTLVIGSQPTRNPTMAGNAGAESVDTVEFPNAAWSTTTDDGAVEHAHGSMFSANFLRDFTKAIDATKMDRVTLKFGDEFPTIMAFEHDDWGFDGQYMLAPRISNDD